jgi:DNA-binding MarR family transcriptional regulator
MEQSANTTAAEASALSAQLRSTVARLSRRFRNERPEGGLGDAALAVLTRLDKYGPQTLTTLSDYDHVAPASMSQTVNRLTSAGFAVRSADPDDGRKVLFAVTVTGVALAAEARAQRHAWLDAQLAALGAEDRRAIARASQLLSDIADA